jgi:hypothetical protein
MFVSLSSQGALLNVRLDKAQFPEGITDLG